LSKASWIALDRRSRRTHALQRLLCASTVPGGIERGVRNPTLTTIWRLAKALGVTPSRLLRAAEE
jgi:hypothetical protein